MTADGGEVRVRAVWRCDACACKGTGRECLAVASRLFPAAEVASACRAVREWKAEGWATKEDAGHMLDMYARKLSVRRPCLHWGKSVRPAAPVWKLSELEIDGAGAVQKARREDGGWSVSAGAGRCRDGREAMDAKVLGAIRSHPMSTVGELAEALGAPRAAVYSSARRLSACGRIVMARQRRKGKTSPFVRMAPADGEQWSVVVTDDGCPDEFPSEPMTLRDAMKMAQKCWARAEKGRHVRVVTYDDSDDVCHNLDVIWEDGGAQKR